MKTYDAFENRITWDSFGEVPRRKDGRRLYAVGSYHNKQTEDGEEFYCPLCYLTGGDVPDVAGAKRMVEESRYCRGWRDGWDDCEDAARELDDEEYKQGRHDGKLFCEQCGWRGRSTVTVMVPR